MVGDDHTVKRTAGAGLSKPGDWYQKRSFLWRPGLSAVNGESVEPVRVVDIAKRLGVKQQTVAMWHYRAVARGPLSVSRHGGRAPACPLMGLQPVGAS